MAPGDGSGSVTTANPYTGQLRVTSYFLFWSSQVTTSWVERLPEFIRQSQWADAFRAYRQMLDGLDLWVADQLRKTGKCTPDEALGNAHQHQSELRTGLEQIADKHAARLPAVFHPDPATAQADKAACPQATDTVPMNVYFWKQDDGKLHLYDLTRPGDVHEQSVDSPLTADIMHTFFEDVARYPKGQVHYTLPGGGDGVAATTGDKKWYEWFGIAALVIAGVGLAVLTAGYSIPATVIFAVGAAAGGVAAAGDLIDSTRLGIATPARVALDVAQIVASFASVGALGITVKAGGALEAI